MEVFIIIGINGFGCIGWMFFRLLLNYFNIKVVVINDIVNGIMMVYLLKYDSIYGVLDSEVLFLDG